MLVNRFVRYSRQGAIRLAVVAPLVVGLLLKVATSAQVVAPGPFMAW